MKLKKNAKIIITIIVVALLLIIAGLVVHSMTSKKEEETSSPVTVESNINNYGYELRSNQTALYKELFTELETVLNKEEVDEKEYVETIAKLFVTDFYTLSNKLTNMDIGGTQFVHTSIRDNFILNAENTMYQYVQSNIYGDREQALPEVNEIVSVETESISYDYLETTDANAYQVTPTWTYKEDLGYETSKILIFVHEDNKLVLVEMK